MSRYVVDGFSPDTNCESPGLPTRIVLGFLLLSSTATPQWSPPPPLPPPGLLLSPVAVSNLSGKVGEQDNPRSGEPSLNSAADPWDRPTDKRQGYHQHSVVQSDYELILLGSTCHLLGTRAASLTIKWRGGMGVERQ